MPERERRIISPEEHDARLAELEALGRKTPEEWERELHEAREAARATYPPTFTPWVRAERRFFYPVVFTIIIIGMAYYFLG